MIGSSLTFRIFLLFLKRWSMICSINLSVEGIYNIWAHFSNSFTFSKDFTALSVFLTIISHPKAFCLRFHFRNFIISLWVITIVTRGQALLWNTASFLSGKNYTKSTIWEWDSFIFLVNAFWENERGSTNKTIINYLPETPVNSHVKWYLRIIS